MDIQPFLLGYALPIVNPHVESWTGGEGWAIAPDSWTGITSVFYSDVRSGHALAPAQWLPFGGRSSLRYYCPTTAASSGSRVDYPITSAAFPFLFDASTHSIAAAVHLWPGSGVAYSEHIRLWVNSTTYDGRRAESYHAWQQSAARFEVAAGANSFLSYFTGAAVQLGISIVGSYAAAVIGHADNLMVMVDYVVVWGSLANDQGMVADRYIHRAFSGRVYTVTTHARRRWALRMLHVSSVDAARINSWFIQGMPIMLAQPWSARAGGGATWAGLGGTQLDWMARVNFVGRDMPAGIMVDQRPELRNGSLVVEESLEMA